MCLTSTVRNFISPRQVWWRFWNSGKDDNACGFIPPKIEILMKDGAVHAYLSQRGPEYPTGQASQIIPRLRSKWHVGLKLCWCCRGTTETRKKHIHKVISSMFSSLCLQDCCDKGYTGWSFLSHRWRWGPGQSRMKWHCISADGNIAQWRAGALWHVINWLLTVLGLWSSGASGTIESFCTDCPGLARHGII